MFCSHVAHGSRPKSYRIRPVRGRGRVRRSPSTRISPAVGSSKYTVARATVGQLEAELAQARVNLEYTVLRAPADGVVLAKLKEVGEIAVPGGFAGSGC